MFLVSLLDSRGACLSAVQGFKESKQASCFSYPAELNTERLNFNEKVLEQIKNNHLAKRFCGFSVQRESRTAVCTSSHSSRAKIPQVTHRSVSFITFISRSF